jgi:hypothetical protein
MSSPTYALDLYQAPAPTTTAAPRQEQAMSNPVYAMEFFASEAPPAAAMPRWSLKGAATFFALIFLVLPLMLVASLVVVGRHRD